MSDDMQPSDVPTCRCWTSARTPMGDSVAGAVFEFDLIRSPADSDDSYSTASLKRTTGADGLVEINLMVGATYQYRWGRRGLWVRFTVPDAQEFKLPPVNDGL